VKGDTVKAVISGTVAAEPYVTRVELPPVTSSNADLLLHRLAAKAQIRVLEDALDEADSKYYSHTDEPEMRVFILCEINSCNLASANTVV
jgi:hypothetical protein